MRNRKHGTADASIWISLRKWQESKGRLSRTATILVAALNLSACLGSLSDGPERLNTIAEETADIRARFGVPTSEYYSWNEQQRASYRDEFITARMYAMDVQYSSFETSLTRERQQIGFLSTTSTIALTGTASLVHPVATKDLLTGIAAGLVGTKAAYSDEILLNKTIQVLQAQMRANRARKAAVILSKLGSPISVYPLGIALSDLEEYYQAGTLTSAWVEVSQTVGQEAINAKYDKDGAIVITQPATDDSYKTLVSMLYPKGIAGGVNANLNNHLKSLLGSNAVNLPVYINDPRYATLRFRMARCLRVFQTDNQCKPGSLAVVE